MITTSPVSTRRQAHSQVSSSNHPTASCSPRAANVVVAERPLKKEDNPGDFMPPRPGRTQLTTSSDQPSTLRVVRGPVATTAEVRCSFYGGGALIRRITFYHDHPSIDFETEINDIPDYTVVVAEFPLAEEVTEIRRGIPYGFSHSGWARPNPICTDGTRASFRPCAG
jgi:hypothetical protein